MLQVDVGRRDGLPRTQGGCTGPGGQRRREARLAGKEGGRGKRWGGWAGSDEAQMSSEQLLGKFQLERRDI